MTKLNDDKQLEEYIQNLLKNYSVPFSEEDRRQLIKAYHHLKVHDSSLEVSLKNVLKNKTASIIFISIVCIILFIYLFAQFFPSEDKNMNSLSYHLNTQDTQSVFTNTESPQKTAILKDSTPVPDKNKSKPISATSKILSSAPPTHSSTTSIKPSVSKDSIFNEVQLNTTDSLSKPTKKKKRRKKPEDVLSEENTLIEPKAPVYNLSTKEEE